MENSLWKEKRQEKRPCIGLSMVSCQIQKSKKGVQSYLHTPISFIGVSLFFNMSQIFHRFSPFPEISSINGRICLLARR